MSKNVQSASARVQAIRGAMHEDTPERAIARGFARLAGAIGLVELGQAHPQSPFNGDCLLGIEHLLRDADADLRAYLQQDAHRARYVEALDGALALIRCAAPSVPLLEDGLDPATLRLLQRLVEDLYGVSAEMSVARSTPVEVLQ